METPAGLENRRHPMANSPEDDRSRRHRNLRLRKLSPLNPGSHAAVEDRRVVSKILHRSELARMRENLHSGQRDIAVRFACSINKPAGEHRRFRALSAFASPKRAEI